MLIQMQGLVIMVFQVSQQFILMGQPHIQAEAHIQACMVLICHM